MDSKVGASSHVVALSLSRWHGRLWGTRMFSEINHVLLHVVVILL